MSESVTLDDRRAESPYAAELADRYCEVRQALICHEDKDPEDEAEFGYNVFLKVESQSFCVTWQYLDTMEEAEWMRFMLGKALAAIIEAE